LRVASGSFLVLVGLLILSGRLARLNIALYRLASGLVSWQQASPAQVRLLFAALLALPGLLLLAFFLAELFGPAGPARRRRLLLRPSLAALFLALAGLTLSGTLNPAGFLAFWLAYQGI